MVFFLIGSYEIAGTNENFIGRFGKFNELSIPHMAKYANKADEDSNNKKIYSVLC